MRFSPWVLSFSLLGIGAAACSSSGPGSSPDAGEGGTVAEGGRDGAAPDSSDASSTVTGCPGAAACYSVLVTIAAGSPASCGNGSATQLADWSTLPANGGPFSTAGCSGQLDGCTMTFTCQNGEAWSVTFAGQGFNATVSLTTATGTCRASGVGTRLMSCTLPSQDAGPDATEDAAVDAPPDVAVSETGTEAGDAGPGPDSGAGLDSGFDSGSGGESGADAGAESGAVPDAGLDSSPDVGASEDSGEDSSEDSGQDSASDGAVE